VSEKRNLLVIGAGGHSKVVIATAVAAGWDPVGIFDDDDSLVGSEILGVRVLGRTTAADDTAADGAIIAVGANDARRRLAVRLDLPWVAVVHPKACVHPSSRVGDGTLVAAGVVIQPDVRIGSHAIINTGSTVDHDCSIGSFVHIAPGTHLAGDVSVGEGTLVGVGSSFIPGMSVGEWAVVGAGSVVVEDLPPHSVAAGVPARPFPSSAE
jgi:sugar O-acyltransferase (sialic acid O-acetyltransferase NeuD family)